MMPQGVAVRDAVKPEFVEGVEQSKTVAKQVADKVSEAGKAKQGGEKKTPLSIEKAVEKSNQMAAKLNSQIRFEVDYKTKNVIVKVINKETGEVIRQIPSEEMSKLASRVDELRGLIFSEDG